MAIGFMPSDAETDARYERLNRVLLELYEIVYHLVYGNPGEERFRSPENDRVRPVSDSSAPSRLPDLLCDASPQRRRPSCPRSTPASPSCSGQHCRTFADLYERHLQDSPSSTYDDEVFFTSPQIQQTPRITLAAPPRQRRRRRRSKSLKEKKSSRTKSEDVTDMGCCDNEKCEDLQTLATRVEQEQDTVDSPQSLDIEKDVESESDTSLISTLLSTRLGGSLWTAVVLVVGWKLFTNKR